MDGRNHPVPQAGPLSAVAAGAAVLPAVTLLVSNGTIDALVLVLVVAALTGMYRLRRYARAELLYRRRAELRGQAKPVSNDSARVMS